MNQQDESIKSFDLPFVTGVEAISGRKINNEFRRHIHQTYIIGIVEQGKRIITHLEGTSLVSENEIFILNPGQVHTCRSESRSGHSYKILSVSCRVMQSIASQISKENEKKPFFKNIRYRNRELSERFKRLFKTIEEPESDIHSESGVIAFLTYLLLNIAESPPPVHDTGNQRDAIERVCRHITRNYAQNLSLKDLAGVACLSPFHFQREFTRNMGITPHEYLRDFRIAQSKKMLLKSEKLADISLQAGFVDQSHFSRIFKKTVGISPGRYFKINKS